MERDFVAWDGEAQDDAYTLLANSLGDTIYDRYGIATETAFDFLCNARRDVNHVWFGVGYDVNMILRDLPWTHVLQLASEGVAFWKGWRIGYIPRKMFQLSHKDSGRSFRSFDVQTFFASSFVGALESWRIPVPNEVIEGKASRDSFAQWTRRDLERYNGLEVELLVRLMDGLRTAIVDAGWGVNGWHGPGALAGWFLGNNIRRDDVATPPELRVPLERAYFGGRVDASGWGSADAYHFDLVSAYPAAMRECPSLDGVTWKRSKKLPSQPFALARVRWRVKDSEQWPPFPWRASDGRILWPTQGEGWYWWPEVDAARRRFGRRMQLRIIEVIEPSSVSFYPMRRPIEGAFEHRRQLKAAGHPANVPIKLGLNSLYGKTAQTVSYGKTPKFYSLAWAGFLTAVTRSRMQEAIAATDGSTFMVMTDAIYAASPLPKSWLGPGLGQWDGDVRARKLRVVGPGVYRYGRDSYTRGFEASAMPDVGALVRRFERGESVVPFKVRRFVGMQLAALGGDWSQQWRTWMDVERDVRSPEVFGTTKRFPLADKRSAWHQLQPYDAAGLSARYRKASLAGPDVEEEKFLGECES